MRYARIALLVLGLVTLGVLVAGNDPAGILASITGLSWRLAVVLCFPVSLVMILDTLGWRFAFPRHSPGFATLCGVRLAGEAFNMVTPTAALGGEAVKVWLLLGRVSAVEAVPSVIVAKTTITIAQGLFLLLGIAVAPLMLSRDSTLLAAMRWLLIVEVVGLTLFVLAQIGGLLGRVGGALSLLRPLRRLAGQASLGGINDELVRFYRSEPRRLALSIVYHLVAWLLGIAETYLILRFLGVDVSLSVATVIEAFGAGIRIATFLVPASLGALEGGFAVIFSAVGLSPAAGLSFSLVRRLREAVWIALGLVVFAAMRPKARASAKRAEAARV